MTIRTRTGADRENPRAGSWGTLNYKYVEVALTANDDDDDVIRAWKIPNGTRIHEVGHYVSDATGNANDRVAIGYGTTEQINNFDAAGSDAARNAAWPAAQVGRFQSAVNTNNVTGISGFTGAPVDIEDDDSWVTVTVQAQDISGVGELGLRIIYEYVGN